MKYLSKEEKQQLLFDWRYKGVSVLNLLTEEQVDEYNLELEKIRLERSNVQFSLFKPLPNKNST